MADKHAKIRCNVPGRYYIDETCIGCLVCSEIAPNHFQSEFMEGYSFVIRQPETPAEEDLCAEAAHICPTESIGLDGL